jgi:hypothetical protein
MSFIHLLVLLTSELMTCQRTRDSAVVVISVYFYIAKVICKRLLKALTNCIAEWAEGQLTVDGF